MQRITFIVPRHDSLASDLAAELYGDLGAGVIDYDKPLSGGRVRFWPAAVLRGGHLREGHLVAEHLDSLTADGHLSGGHLLNAHLAPGLAIALRSPRYVFGRFQHAIRLFDRAGNAGAPTEFAQTINAAPPTPQPPRRIGWDPIGRRVQFAIKPVRFAAAHGA